jgi:hypothetical protein
MLLHLEQVILRSLLRAVAKHNATFLRKVEHKQNVLENFFVLTVLTKLVFFQANGIGAKTLPSYLILDL